MRVRLLLLIMPLLLEEARCQQVPQYTQFVFNYFAINPAVAGSKDCMDVRLGFRKQWVGFPGAPTTGWVTMHGYLRPKGKPFIKHRHGVGAFIESDETGPLGYSSLYLAYAYHIQLAKDYYLSLGLFGGVKQEKLDLGKVTVVDANDPALVNDGSVLVYPEIVPGIWLYGKNGWAGISIAHALGNRIKDLGTDSRLTRHFMISGGKRVRFNRTIGLVPSVLVKYSPGSPMALDVNMMLEYRRRVGLGVSYRNQDAVAFMMKIPFLKYFTLGYSYDVNTSRLRVDNSNTHEVILAIYPCGANDPAKEIVRCPVFQ
jgi:type IX secretion system PorP/SprF family membrane protein